MCSPSPADSAAGRATWRRGAGRSRGTLLLLRSEPFNATERRAPAQSTRPHLWPLPSMMTSSGAPEINPRRRFWPSGSFVEVIRVNQPSMYEEGVNGCAYEGRVTNQRTLPKTNSCALSHTYIVCIHQLYTLFLLCAHIGRWHLVLCCSRERHMALYGPADACASKGIRSVEA